MKNRLPPRLIVPWLAVHLLLGCSGSGLPRTHSGKGSVLYKGGDVRSLEQGTVEFQLVSDPTIIAVGEIQADGSFFLQTWSADGRTMAEGVAAGEHKVRVLPPSPREETSRNLIHAQFQNFETSGIRITIPAQVIEITVGRNR